MRTWVPMLMCALASVAACAQRPPFPPAFATPSVLNPPRVVPATAGWKPQAPAGFTVAPYAEALRFPRWLAVAPNGDVFVADTLPQGDVVVLHGASRASFATGLRLPFGIAFHDDYVYIADTDEVLRYRYDPKTSTRLGNREHVLSLPAGGEHFTRSLAFSPDGAHLAVSVGSDSNDGEDRGGTALMPSDCRRAAVLVADPDGNGARLFATGLRNAAGLAFDPETGELWAAVNERDYMGDDVPPDFFTRLRDGGFYGWPYSYIGAHVDQRVKPERPDLVATAIVPDVLLRAHVAPLQFQFYEAQQFPEAYRHGVFLAEHGSGNRRLRQGYDVVFIPFRQGRPSGPPQAFLQGFAPDPAQRGVFGRPVGVAVASDGSLLVSDDGGRRVWQVRYGQ